MTDPGFDRPSSAAAGYHATSIPPSPRPSVAGRASRSSLRRDRDSHDLGAFPRPASAALSHGTPHDEQQYRPPSTSSPPQPQPTPQPTFPSLFALLTSTSHASGHQTTHHPAVRYIFADDDPEILTSELAQYHQIRQDGSEDNLRPSHRAIIMNIDQREDDRGFEVAWASSLSPSWAVTSASVGRMDGGGNSVGGLVLKVEGVSLEPPAALTTPSAPGKTQQAPEATDMHSSGASGEGQQRRPQSKQKQSSSDEYAVLLQDFEKRMAVLRKVTEAGAERERVIREHEHGDVATEIQGGYPFAPVFEGSGGLRDQGER
ncbi:hypothetical protein B0T21DRAFT_66746 [Apiosordaria backusii]|uniref:Uncharacterized protein n=1 Tax=Apiosordaria backusii TaxID=314023 RepID=A0AA40AEB2_9PEZI|nr:hypothetical protein B0T21DRAFT_66746 [Apiosordaria backusii]